jgi:hypothetical protein
VRRRDALEVFNFAQTRLRIAVQNLAMDWFRQKATDCESMAQDTPMRIARIVGTKNACGFK